MAAPRRFARPNQTPYAPESMKEGFVPALPPGDESRLESMIREAEKKMEVRFHMERTQLHDQLSFFKRECESKSAASHRLQLELEEARIIIKKCGLEIVELRQHQQRLLADKAELVARVESDSKAVQDVAGDSAIVSLDRSELEQRFKMLSDAYKREKGASAELVGRMKTLHKESLKNKDSAAKLSQLEDAHMAQAKTMQQLQEQNGKLAQYVQATRDQEKVIERLEDVMEKTLAEARQGRDIKAERDMLHTEILR
jgi:chromosome segregation ATPase